MPLTHRDNGASMGVANKEVSTTLWYLAPFWGRDPHGEEGGIDRSFDLQCQRLAEIMGLY